MGYILLADIRQGVCSEVVKINERNGDIKMFKNLEAEMTRQGISYEKMAESLEISYHSFRFKMKGITEWKFSEMVMIRKILSVDEKLSFEYLFETS